MLFSKNLTQNMHAKMDYYNRNEVCEALSDGANAIGGVNYSRRCN